MPKLRVSLGFNAGAKAGQPAAVAVVETTGAALMQAATNKLRLKKKDAAVARLYVWRSGAEVDTASSDVRACVLDGDLVVVALGEPFSGKMRGAEAGESSTAAARWEMRSPDLALVEWSSAAVMNRALGRASTLLEHPSHRGALVSHEAQAGLPSASYLGHNLYVETLRAFATLATPTEAQAGPDAPSSAPGCPQRSASNDGASAAERAFLVAWHDHGAPRVVISYVAGKLSTLSHELCHARYALLPAYQQAVDAAWDGWEPRLSKWMGDLGYHASRHADEFGAYLLTEPHAFWRGRVPPDEAQALRARLARAVGQDSDVGGGPFGLRPVGEGAC